MKLKCSNFSESQNWKIKVQQN